MTQTAVSTSDLKAHCSEIIESVSKERREVTITRHGKPVARLVPLEKAEERDLFGCAKGWITIHGDIMEPIDVEWEADR